MPLTRLSILLCLAALLVPAGAAAALGGEEPFFPRAGNRGYDVQRYDVSLAYRPGPNHIKATELIQAQATQGLRTFSLDLYGLRVRSVQVAGRPARFERGAGKLRITVAEPIAAGAEFRIALRYEGRPRPLIGADGAPQGWQRTDDGAVTMSEPLGTATWLACNNVPWDKAAFGISVRVPRPLVAASNGRLKSFDASRRSHSTYRWEETQPMSPYLAVVGIGRGKLFKHEVAGRPSWSFVDPRFARLSRSALRDLPEIVRFLSRAIGPYPFETAGSIVDFAPSVGYALETQSRPIYTEPPVRGLIVHETAHQWFGDSVGLKRWPDIWLNEGFATWAQWYYAEEHDGPSAASIFRELRQTPASRERFWNPPPGRPGTPKNLFDPTIYVRGAMTLQALRQEIGTKPMLQVLRRWVAEHRHGSADTGEFIALAEEVSGKDLDPLFQRWLFQRGKPR
ncbi:MAG TPA: M1 family metallopeptidase [Solirubrobacterales bacterium]|nr:M1 family metallopeptidase [Solirubrobacterales bacterium]